MNQQISLAGVTIVPSRKADDDTEYTFLYNYDGSGDRDNSDIYFKIRIGDKEFTMVVRRYLTDKNSDFFKMVEDLQIGHTVDIEGFLYWYDGPQPHVTKVEVFR